MGGFPILNLQLVKKWAPEFLKNWFSILEVPVVKFKWVKRQDFSDIFAFAYYLGICMNCESKYLLQNI